ncbi:hypothetical protein [Castellaniella sp.]|uniref:hypothetical protein n=1 Tax=Castellaniella sp. TaxID=1955812 RepID=UPI00355EDEB9
MAINYPSIAEGAHAAILDAGGPVTLTKPGESGYTPGQGPTNGASTDYNCVGVVLDFGLSDAGLAFDGATLILAGDRWLILSPDGVPTTFAPGWHVSAFGESYAVAAVKVTAPAGTPVLYEALVRK